MPSHIVPCPEQSGNTLMCAEPPSTDDTSLRTHPDCLGAGDADNSPITPPRRSLGELLQPARWIDLLPLLRKGISFISGSLMFAGGVRFIAIIIPPVYLAIQQALHGGAYAVADGIALLIVAVFFCFAIYAALWAGLECRRIMENLLFKLQDYVIQAISRLSR